MPKGPSPYREEKTRLNLAVRPHVFKSVTWLLDNTTHPTMTEVVETAINLYRTILENKYRILKANNDNGVVIITSGSSIGGD